MDPQSIFKLKKLKITEIIQTVVIKIPQIPVGVQNPAALNL